MSIFSKILDKLGLNKAKAAEAAQAQALADMAKKETDARAKMAAAKPVAQAKPATPVKPAEPVEPVVAAKAQPNPAQNEPPEKPVTPPAPVAISEVDVVKKLEDLAAANPLKLNWKVSISDLLFLLGLDNSYEARKELAVELGCPAELMHDSAKMNTWLHKTVLKLIAQNGGNIPQSLLD